MKWEIHANDVYYLFHIIGFVLAIGYTILSSGKFGIKRLRVLLLIVFGYVTTYALMLILFFIITGNIGGQNIIRIFVLLPAVIAFYSKSFGIPIKKAMDLIAPVPCLVHGVSHIGCIFPGCCYSNIEVDWGLYSGVAEKMLFPCQLLESAVAIGIFIYLIRTLKKHQFNMGGTAMPIMLILFGSTRFLLEFLRDNEKIIAGISELAIWAFGTVIVGAVWLIIKKQITKRGEAI